MSFTAGAEFYANALLDKLDPNHRLIGRLTRRDCTPPYYIKDITYPNWIYFTFSFVAQNLFIYFSVQYLRKILSLPFSVNDLDRIPKARNRNK